MPHKNRDLHGNAPDKAEVVLLLIDVINDLEWGSDMQPLPQFIEMARNIASLKKRASEAGIPAVYVNDNFGRWRSDFKNLVEHCLNDDVAGKELVEILKPDDDDYFVLKPKHSAFFSTTLDTLLQYLGARTLILTGIQTNICVLFTANDAYVRDYTLYIPRDCSASEDLAEHEHTMKLMHQVLKADTSLSGALDLRSINRLADAGDEQNSGSS